MARLFNFKGARCRFYSKMRIFKMRILASIVIMVIRKRYRELLSKGITDSPTSHHICNDGWIWSAPAAGAKASHLRLCQRRCNEGS